jgi:hypothetical protein
MSYVINRYSGSQLVVIDDATLDNTTSINLVGRNYTGYGEIQNENFLFLLENFANSNPPFRPISGQLWYNTTTKTLNLYSGDSWRSAASADVSSTAPDATQGAIWLNTATNQLFIQNNGWNLIGPEVAEGFGITKLESVVVKDRINVDHAVILIKIDDTVIGVISKIEFVLSDSTPIDGFNTLLKGINLLQGYQFKGPLIGNASSASNLETARSINGVPFDGTRNIVIKSSTTKSLKAGDFIVGNDFDGSDTTTWSVNASSSNSIGKIVSRDASGNFQAGTITANIVGNHIGSTTHESGTSNFDVIEANLFKGANLVGNASTATRLETGRNINNVLFDGTQDITVPAAASTLTGFRLSATVIESNLTTVGTLNSLNTLSAGVSIEDTQLKLYHNLLENKVFVETENTNGINIRVKDESIPQGVTDLFFVNGLTAESLGAERRALISPAINSGINLGSFYRRFNKIYANNTSTPILATEEINSTASNNNITMGSNLIVNGDLTVNGTTTTVNSIEVAIDDKTLTIANDSTTQQIADGAGIIINGANVRLLYSSTGDKMTLNKPLDLGTNNFVTTGSFVGTATSARYADLAENYVADDDYIPGTVLEFGGNFEVTLASDGTTRVAGVVTTNPAYLMNKDCKGEYIAAIALQGRTPCRVRGKIEKGDMLISAGSGFARACRSPQIGTILGKALESFNGVEGVIEVVVGRL